jgi:uroporphyrin-3 C-methyltransferase
MTENEKDASAKKAGEAVSTDVQMAEEMTATEHKEDASETDVKPVVVDGSDVVESGLDENDVDGNDVDESDLAKGSQYIEEKDHEPSRSRNNVLWLVLFFNLLFIIAAVAGGYWFWTKYNKDLSSLQQIQIETQAQITASQTAFERVEQLNVVSNEQWQTAVSELEQLVVASAQRLNREANRTQNRWPLEEALTLSRLAQQRLQLDASAGVAIGLLKTADEILAGLDPASVLPLRRQVAADILALQTTKAADLHGLYFQLEAIADQIRDLNWIPKPITSEPIPEGANIGEGFWHSLKQIVVITKLDVPREVQPLLTDFEQWRQRQLLLIEQTQLALLAQNQLLFDAALAQTISSVEVMVSQFDLSILQSNLSGLEDSVLNPKWPELNKSVEVIELYLSEQKEEIEEVLE